MKTAREIRIRPNTLEWRIAFDLAYWRGIYIADRRAWPASRELHEGSRQRSAGIVHIAREAVQHMSRAKRRAFGAAIRSTLRSTLQWKQQLRAA